jgi:N-acetylneuraminic acid mutarotase
MTTAARPRLAILALLGLTLGALPLAAAEPGSWSQKAPLPAPRNEADALAIDGKIYVIGGSAEGDYQVAKNEVYDPVTDRWRALAPLPKGINHGGAAVVDGKIYEFGGFTGAQHKGAVEFVFAYDPKTDRWQPLAALSSPRGSIAVAALDGKIHIVGGRGLDDKTVATHELFNPATGKWATLAPLPAARDHVALVAVGGKLHAIGGRTSTPETNITAHDIYDPATDKWQSAAPLLMPVSNAAATVYRGMILLAGGEGPGQGASGAFTQHQGYDLAGGTWQKLAELPVGKHGWTGVTIGDRAYFPGGSNTNGSGGATAELMVFELR